MFTLHFFYPRQSASDISVVAGSNFLSKGGETHNVSELIPHPQYISATVVNDIGLIQLSDTVTYGKKIQNIALPEKEQRCGTELVLSGWGTTSVSTHS